MRTRLRCRSDDSVACGGLFARSSKATSRNRNRHKPSGLRYDIHQYDSVGCSHPSHSRQFTVFAMLGRLVKHSLHHAVVATRTPNPNTRSEGTGPTTKTRRDGTHQSFSRPAGIVVRLIPTTPSDLSAGAFCCLPFVEWIAKRIEQVVWFTGNLL